MRAISLNVGLLVTFFVTGEVVSESSPSSDERREKHFSLFSVVTFKNDECSSESTLAGGTQIGTCYSTTECSDKNGMKSGNCASGFGVCCVFLETSQATATISQNRTIIRNSEYPAYATTTSAIDISYTLKKMSTDICQIRLDFHSFVIAGPINSKEQIVGTSLATINHCTNDVVTFVQTGGSAVPQMCGALTGEHLYLDLGADTDDTSVVKITAATTVAAATAQRIWDIQTSQIECFAPYRAPEGCHRYFTSDHGKIISMNFLSLTTTTLGDNTQNSGLELGAQILNTCIRRSKGMCCVEYQVCTSYNSIALTETDGNDANDLKGTYPQGWTIDTNTSPMTIKDTQTSGGMVDGMCSGDYVEIPSSWSGSCGANGSGRGTINSRYCGAGFGANLHASIIVSTTVAGVTTGTGNTPVCDCSQPFVVRHNSDMANDLGGQANLNKVNTNTNITPRGFCLDFTQQPCYF